MEKDLSFRQKCSMAFAVKSVWDAMTTDERLRYLRILANDDRLTGDSTIKEFTS